MTSLATNVSELSTASTSRPARDAPGMRVVIVGGGLAGMAAAVALETFGVDVTLLEARRVLGGRATSFEDPQSGEELDNCQHVLLGCCTNLIDFYKRVGAADLIRFERTIHFVDGAGDRYDLSGTRGLPAPLHLGLAMAGFGLLSWSERISLSRAMLAMMHLGSAGRKRLADVAFGQWLDEHRQSASLVKKLYDTLLIGALNERTRDASAEFAIQVFQQSLLGNADGYVLGLPGGPLRGLYERLPCRDVRTGVRVKSLSFKGNHATGVVLSDGEELSADAVVIATPWHAASRLVPEDLARSDERFRELDRLESVPILGAHLWFDRPVLAESHAALVEGPLQWLFRKDEQGLQVHGVISAARDWVGKSKEECLALFEHQICATFPAARHAKLLRGVIVVEKRATFAPTPGVDRLRPHQGPGAGGIDDLYLAGDYTQTSWPATMEGAVRSGYLAAAAVMERAKSGVNLLVADLPDQWPARWLGQT